MLSLILFALALFPSTVLSYTSYDNVFVNASYVVGKKFPKNTAKAQQTILSWADESSKDGPWSVTDKPVAPPNGDKHAYMSWAPYWWPNCNGVNPKPTKKEDIWKQCPYVRKDGNFNPDRTLVNNVITVNKMADAVLYNSLAWAIDGSSKYEQRVVDYINTWFLDEKTYMKPNLDYGQMHRGPGAGQKGTATGLLDLKCMAKVASGILILREKKSALWTSDHESQMKNWTTSYLHWVETASISLAEEKATNNHGSYFANQVAALKIILEDMDGAKESLQKYFSGVFQGQIEASGEQPLEASRADGYHYRIYNLAALTVNARLADYVGLDAWNIKTKKGGTIRKATEFLMNLDPKGKPTSSLMPNVATIGSVFGDNDGKYASYLKKHYSEYSSQPFFLWSQPLAA